MADYVAGFAFRCGASQPSDVLLIQKNKPVWQRGLLNGIGGKIESYDSSPAEAMVREFQEETGIVTLAGQWTPVVRLAWPDTDGNRAGSVQFYQARLHTSVYATFRTMETEEVRSYPLDLYGRLSPSVARLALPNLHWLLSLAFYSDTEYLPFTVHSRGEEA